MADEATLPTEQEIATLPRWARVAFAARCARRVLPLYQLKWPNAPKEYIDAVARAVETAEQAAAAAHATADLAFAAAAAQPAGFATVDAATAAADFAALLAARHAAFAAAAAARATLFAANADAEAGDSYAAYTYDRSAALFADHASSDAARTGATVHSLVKDFQTVRDLARSENWTDDTPVPPWVFGPMWPDRVPDGWPEADPSERLVIHLTAPGAATAEQTEELKSRLLRGVARVFAANGLIPQQFSQLVRVELTRGPVGVSSTPGG